MRGAAGGTPDPGDSDGEGSGHERPGRRNDKQAKRKTQPAEKEKTGEEKYRGGQRTKCRSLGH